MFKLDVPLNSKEAAYIERRRRLEEERKARIFNSKYRTIGVDKEALDQQVRDKNCRDLREKERGEAFMKDLLHNCKLSQIIEQQEEKDRRRINSSLNEYRSNNQQPQTRREWDINDPEFLKKWTPARLSDDDVRCGPSSIQKFEGEDLDSDKRRLFQQEQNREWLKQQMESLGEEKARQRKADELYHQKMNQLDERLSELCSSEEECRRAIKKGLMDYNQELANHKNHERTREKVESNNDKITHMLNVINSDMLTENPAVAQSVYGPNRVIPDRWKGMSEAQREEISRIRQLQVDESKRLKKEEKVTDEMWQEQLTARDRAALLLEREQQRNKAELNKRTSRENRRLAEEQRSNQEYLNKCVYTNEPQYFCQFNTTSR